MALPLELGQRHVVAVLVAVEPHQRARQRLLADVQRQRQEAVGRDHGVLLVGDRVLEERFRYVCDALGL